MKSRRSTNDRTLQRMRLLKKIYKPITAKQKMFPKKENEPKDKKQDESAAELNELNVGDIQGHLLSAMIDAGQFAHVKWINLSDMKAMMTGTEHTSVFMQFLRSNGIDPNNTVVTSNSWSSLDNIFKIINFIQINAIHKKSITVIPSGYITEYIKKASKFTLEEIEFIVLKTVTDGVVEYSIFAAPVQSANAYAEDNTNEELNRLKELSGIDVDESTPAANFKALVGSGRADPSGKKTNPDSAAHKSVRTPGTTYSKKPNQKKYGKIGANDGFVG